MPLAASSHALWSFYAAMLLVGAGYSFAGNIPAVFLLSAWFPRRAARANGLYMMTGALGSVAGPPLVEFLLRIGGGWRGLWWVLTALAAALALPCLLLVRDAAPPAGDEATMPRGEIRRSVRTLPFLLVGAGCGLTYVAGNVMTIETFGHRHGSTLLSVAWLASTAAAIGPLVAGVVIDRTGSVVPIFLVQAALFACLAGALLRRHETRPDTGCVPVTPSKACL